MKNDWGRPRLKGRAYAAWIVCHWLWLDAIAYAVLRTYRLRSADFNRWCDEVDRLFSEKLNWPRAYTVESGRDDYIDSWVSGLTPQEEFDDQLQHFCD